MQRFFFLIFLYLIFTSSLINKVPCDEKSYSVYRDRLIKRGLIVGLEQGKIMLTLPRFEVFISNQE